MLYTLTRRKESEITKLLGEIEIPEYFRNIHNLLNLKYMNDLSEMWLNCDLDLNDKQYTYKICFTCWDDIFGKIVKKYETTDFVKVCYMIKFLKELVESADHYGEKETKNENLYKECINTIRQYFDVYFEELYRKDI